MATFANAVSVAEAFAEHRPAHNGAFVTHGDAIYSYDMRLAHWADDHSAVIFDYQRLDDHGSAPSVTTARHMRALEATITGAPVPYVASKLGPRCAICRDKISGPDKRGRMACKACGPKLDARPRPCYECAARIERGDPRCDLCPFGRCAICNAPIIGADQVCGPCGGRIAADLEAN